MKMPLYLASDILGKVLILLSIGVQLLIMTPMSEEVSKNRIDALVEMAILNHRINMINLGVPPENSPTKQIVAMMLQDEWRELDRKVDIEILTPAQVRKFQNIFVALFALGTVLTLAGTYLEKRNKPAP